MLSRVGTGQTQRLRSEPRFSPFNLNLIYAAFFKLRMLNGASPGAVSWPRVCLLMLASRCHGSQ